MFPQMIGHPKHYTIMSGPLIVMDLQSTFRCFCAGTSGALATSFSLGHIAGVESPREISVSTDGRRHDPGSCDHSTAELPRMDAHGAGPITGDPGSLSCRTSGQL